MAKNEDVYTKVFVVDNSVYTIEKLDEIFYTHREDFKIELIESARTFSEVVERKAQAASKADVFLISMMLPDRNGYELIHYIKKNINPNAKFIAMATETTKNLLEKAMAAGSDANLIKQFSGREAIEKIYDVMGLNFYQTMEVITNKRVVQPARTVKPKKVKKRAERKPAEEVKKKIEKKRSASVKEEMFALKKKEKQEEKEQEPQVETEIVEKNSRNNLFKENVKEINKSKENAMDFDDYDDEEEIVTKKPETKVYSFVAPKSYGKTTALVNVGAEISKNSDFKPKTILLDLDLSYPTVFYKFKEEELTKASKNIYDLVEDLEIIDESLIKDTCHIHKETNLYILNTPHELMRDPNVITRKKLQKLIEELKKHFDLVLIDASGNVDEDTVKVPLLMSDASLVFFNSEITSLFHTKKFVKMIRRLEDKVNKNIIEDSYFILNGLNEDKDYVTFSQIKEAVFNFEEDIEIDVPLFIPQDNNLTYYSVIGQLAVLTDEKEDKKKDKTPTAKEKYQELAAILYPMHKGKKGRKTNKKEINLFGLKISK